MGSNISQNRVLGEAWVTLGAFWRAFALSGVTLGGFRANLGRPKGTWMRQLGAEWGPVGTKLGPK